MVRPMNRAISSSASPTKTSPKVKKFFFPMPRANSRLELPNRIAESAFKISQRVDSEPVNVESGDYVLVGSDQELLKLNEVRPGLLQGCKIANRVVGSRKTLPAVKGIIMQVAPGAEVSYIGRS